MGRRQKPGRPIPNAALILLDKPEGPSSNQALGFLRRQPGIHKAGHCGTLDPMASGLLVCLVNRGTGLAQFFEAHTKVYDLTVRFGAEYDTEDITGTLTAETSSIPTIEQIHTAIPSFTGEIDQIPPRFSALHVDGQRAYQLARQGQDFQLPSRRVTIHQIDVLDAALPDLKLRVTCGKGTYMRSLARDLGRAVGSHAAMSALRRIQSGLFHVDDASPMQDGVPPTLHPLAGYLPDLPRRRLTRDEFSAIIATGDIRRSLSDGGTLALHTVLEYPDAGPWLQMVGITGEGGRFQQRLVLPEDCEPFPADWPHSS